MTNISTGRQRGIVPFVDETTGRLPDQYIPQKIIDLQGDLEQAVTNASTSATAASQSASQAQSSATAANSSAQAASTSSESARTASDSATSSKDAAAQSASQASASAQAAETSKTNAASSASAAGASETNAASSASAAKVSETNAAASATAAQQAVDGFGLEVGTTTTGNSGTDAVVEIEKNGTKYTANFTIPRGDKGEPASVEHDDTLTGDGTSGSPLGLVDGNIINPINTDDAESVDLNKLYIIASNTANIPSGGIRGNLYYSRVGSAYFQIIFGYSDLSSGPVIYMRKQWTNITGSQWVRFINEKDLSNYVPLATYKALEARVQALEAKLSNQ